MFYKKVCDNRARMISYGPYSTVKHQRFADVLYLYSPDYPIDALTENSPVSGSSLKKAEIFFEYFDIFAHLK